MYLVGQNRDVVVVIKVKQVKKFMLVEYVAQSVEVFLVNVVIMCVLDLCGIIE